MEKRCPPQRGSVWQRWEETPDHKVRIIQVLVIRVEGVDVIFDSIRLCKSVEPFWCATDIETFCKYFEPAPDL